MATISKPDTSLSKIGQPVQIDPVEHLQQYVQWLQSKDSHNTHELQVTLTSLISPIKSGEVGIATYGEGFLKLSKDLQTLKTILTGKIDVYFSDRTWFKSRGPGAIGSEHPFDPSETSDQILAIEADSGKITLTESGFHRSISPQCADNLLYGFAVSGLENPLERRPLYLLTLSKVSQAIVT